MEGRKFKRGSRAPEQSPFRSDLIYVYLGWHWNWLLKKTCCNQQYRNSKALLKHDELEMWANSQRDGRPAKYRWCSLFNAAKFGWRLLLQCRAVTLPRRETRWNLQGCLKLTNRSQLLVSRSSLYCGYIWGRYCCLTSFFLIVDTCLSCKDIARQSCAMVLRWRFLAMFLGPAFPASRAHISDLHSKFALGPHHV